MNLVHTVNNIVIKGEVRMRVEDLAAYEVLEKREIKDLNSVSYLVKHKKTGARLALLSNDDKNKVFYIGFRTPPEDSTGVAHIVEHTVLCGSKEFPVKDPFVELVKGSLNTFLNAMTYPDKTVYPVASCNDKDFQNLMHVYLDAVFYPNIYGEEKIFLQEGWHYEMESEDSELTLNGVVYNEMKGAFSSPDGVFEREIMNSLYPDVTYGVESGGDPDVIPKLTYEQFLDFHGRYYHPSNSYIYLYGNMDMAEKLMWIDERYLSSFDALAIDSTVKKQKAFDAIRKVKKSYPISEEESLEESTYFSYNTVIEDSLNRDYYRAFQLLDYAIISAPGAPLKQRLVDEGIGTEVYGFYENGIAQPYFSIVAKNCNEEDEERFVQIVEEELTSLCKNGINQKSLEAALNYYEFKYRESDYGSYPKGLMYGLQVLDSWLYDENKPFIHIEANDTFKRLREKLGTGYYEALIEKYFLNNTHKTILTVVPEKGLTAKKEEKLRKELAEYKAKLSKEEIAAIVHKTKELKEYQQEESSPEDLAKIPLLAREDLTRNAEPLKNEVRNIQDTKVLFHPIFTNGINYVRMIFDISHLPEKLLPYLGLLKSVMGLVDTEKYSYGDLFNEINTHTGGIESIINTYRNRVNFDEYKITYELKAKSFYSNTGKALELMQEMALNSKLDDTKRLLELVSENKSRLQAQMTSSGHSLAAARALSYQSEVVMIGEYINGLEFFRFLESLEKDWENRKEEVCQKLKETADFIFTKEHLMADITADEEGYGILEKEFPAFYEKLPSGQDACGLLHLTPEKKNEGLTTSAQIQYVCRAGNFVKHGLPYTGALLVLKVLMGYNYLWEQVRVQGGAYGCMSNYRVSGDCYFVSYRDPNLTRTIDVFEKAAEYVKNLNVDEREMTKYIIGAISDLDTPLNPPHEGARSLAAYLSNVTNEDFQRERDEVLDLTLDNLHELSKYIEAFISDECICVVGNEDNIKNNSELFMNVESLFH